MGICNNGLLICPIFFQQSIVNYNCRELVRKVPFFSDADPEFVSAIITKLEFEVYLEDDIIIREGQMGTEMYFLKSGVVSVSCEGKVSDDLTEGSYFGGKNSIFSCFDFVIFFFSCDTHFTGIDRD